MSLERKLTPVMLPPGRFRLSTRPILIGSPPTVKTIGIVVVVVLADRCVVGHCSNDRDSALDHIDSKRGKPISLTLGRSVLDYYVLAFDITDLAQALAELGQPTRVGFEWRGVEKRDHRYSRLLRPRSERPCCGTADHSNEVAPSHLPGPWLGTGIVTSNQETGRGQAVARRCPLWVKSRHSGEE